MNTIKITRKRDYNFVVTLKDENGSPINITGWTVYFMVKRKLSDSDTDALFSVNGTLSIPTSGVFSIILSQSDTDQTEGKYFYAIDWNTGSKVESGGQGNFIIEDNLNKGI